MPRMVVSEDSCCYGSDVCDGDFTSKSLLSVVKLVLVVLVAVASWPPR